MGAEMPFMESNWKNQVKIPKSKAKLKRPVDKRHALLRIEKNNVWIRSLDRELGEIFCSLVTQGDTVSVKRSVGVIVWGTYAGDPENTGTMILDNKPDGTFKLVPLDDTPESLLKQVANFVGRDGTVTSKQGRHGLTFRGELRKPGKPIETQATAQKPETETASASEKASTESISQTAISIVVVFFMVISFILC